MIAYLAEEMWLVDEAGSPLLVRPFARFADGRGAPGLVDGHVRVLKPGTAVTLAEEID